MATHSSVLAWRIPGMWEPGGLPSLGSHRVGHDWNDLAAAANYGLAGLGPKLKGFHFSPFSHSWLPSRPFIKKQTHTYFLTACWYFNYQHLGPCSLQRWPSLCVWSLRKWLFCQCFSWSDSRLCKVLGSRWAQKGTWRIAAIMPQRQDKSLNQNLVCTSRLMTQIRRVYEKIHYS